MDDRQAFKFGFLNRCAAEGLSPEQALARARQGREKLAGLGHILGAVAGSMTNAGKTVADKALSVGVPAALAGPPILGGLAGLTAARMTATDDTDPADVRDREKIDTYRREAMRLIEAKNRRHQESQRRPRSIHF